MRRMQKNQDHQQESKILKSNYGIKENLTSKDIHLLNRSNSMKACNLTNENLFSNKNPFLSTNWQPTTITSLNSGNKSKRIKKLKFNKSNSL